MIPADANLLLAKDGWDYFDSATDGTDHDVSDEFLDTGGETKPRTVCEHWQGVQLDVGAVITAITLLDGQACYGLPAFDMGGFFPMKFTAISVTGKCLCIRKQKVI